ncbi:MAG: hypothetical protein Kow00109_11490 [Acidobacteriota bacterium]
MERFISILSIVFAVVPAGSYSAWAQQDFVLVTQAEVPPVILAQMAVGSDGSVWGITPQHTVVQARAGKTQSEFQLSGYTPVGVKTTADGGAYLLFHRPGEAVLEQVTADGEIAARVELPEVPFPADFAVLPDGGIVILAGVAGSGEGQASPAEGLVCRFSPAGELQRCDLEGLQPQRAGQASRLAVSAAGEVAVFTPWDRTIRRLDAEGRLTREVKVPEDRPLVTALGFVGDRLWVVLNRVDKRPAPSGVTIYAVQQSELWEVPRVGEPVPTELPASLASVNQVFPNGDLARIGQSGVQIFRRR